MYSETKLNFNFTTLTAANSAKRIAREVILSQPSDSFYFRNAAKNTAANLDVESTTLLFPNNRADILAEEWIKIAPLIAQAIATESPDNSFSFEIYSVNDYSEIEIEGEYKNGELAINSTYYPSGYCEYLHCPECGEEVVRIDEYSANNTYICPVCGEEVDLSEDYKESAPQIAKTIIEIK